MLENRHPHGNMGVLVNAARAGLGVSTTTPQSVSA
jgi:hypothetical protein